MDGTTDDGGLAERYEAAREVVLRAGALAAEYAGRLAELDVRWKGAQDVVTEADPEVELLIKRGLAEFGADGFLGEETGAEGIADAEGVWVVDPIDGTQPFVSGMHNWCVSIGYVHGGEPAFGFVHSPPLGELFEGGRGRPGLLNGRPVAPHPATGPVHHQLGTGEGRHPLIVAGPAPLTLPEPVEGPHRSLSPSKGPRIVP